MKFKSLLQLLRRLQDPSLIGRALSEKLKAEVTAQFRRQAMEQGLMQQSAFDFYFATVATQTERLVKMYALPQLPAIERLLRDDPQSALRVWGSMMRSLDARAKTVTNTVLAGLQRRAAREQAGTNTRFALYIGPERDKVIRPYCAALVGKVVELDKLPPNGHGLPPADFAGGWNCRHSLVPVPADFDGAPRATAEDYAKAAAGARQ